MKSQLKITKGGKQCGVFHTKVCRLSTTDNTLRRLFLKARDSGMESLGRMDTPYKPGGPIVEQMRIVLLRAGDLESLYEFARWLRQWNYNLELNR